MVNKFSVINKTTDHLSPQFIKHKIQHMMLEIHVPARNRHIHVCIVFGTAINSDTNIRYAIHLLREHLSSIPVFLVGSDLLIFKVCMCCPIMCLYVLSSMLWCPLRVWHKHDVRLVFISGCVYLWLSCLSRNCVCLRIVTFCVVFLFCLSSSYVPYVASFS